MTTTLESLTRWREKRIENARARSVVIRANARHLHELAEHAPPELAEELRSIAGTIYQCADSNVSSLNALQSWPFHASGIAWWPKRGPR